jgi:hypothetical protein
LTGDSTEEEDLFYKTYTLAELIPLLKVKDKEASLLKDFQHPNCLDLKEVEPSTGAHLLHYCAAMGRTKLLDYLLFTCELQPGKYTDKWMRTPSFWAAFNGQHESLNLLFMSR